MYRQPYSENFNQYRSQVPYENQNIDFDGKGNVYGRDVSHAPGIALDDYNSDLNFVIESDGVTGSSLHNDGFEYMWAGARATHGVKTGKVYFEVSVLEKLPVTMPQTETNPHVVRLGWSVDRANLQVGEDNLSFGYGGTGKASVNNKFFNYGEPYTSGDIISCYIDLDANPGVVLYSKNGKYLGVAFHLDHSANGQTFFPHVTVKNMRLRINFGQLQSYFHSLEGFCFLTRLPPNLLERGSTGPMSREQCEIIMMVGLPGCGKTVWANRYLKDHPEKKFNILGTNSIMDRMKVMGLMRKRNYHCRWDTLIKRASDILNKVFKIAERKNRNYILDQTNVYFSARRRKMNNFKGFHRVAAVIVNSNEVLKERTEMREKEEGKIVPQSAVMEMKANFVLPQVGEVFDDIWFIEEDRASSERLVSEFQREGKEFKESEKKRKPEDPTVDGQKFPAFKRQCGAQERPHIPPKYIPGGFQGNLNPREPRSVPPNEPRHGSLPGTYGAPLQPHNDFRPPLASYDYGSQGQQETHSEPHNDGRYQSRYVPPRNVDANYQPHLQIPSHENRSFQPRGEGYMNQFHYQGPHSGDFNSHDQPDAYWQRINQPYQPTQGYYAETPRQGQCGYEHYSHGRGY